MTQQQAHKNVQDQEEEEEVDLPQETDSEIEEAVEDAEDLLADIDEVLEENEQEQTMTLEEAIRRGPCIC